MTEWPWVAHLRRRPLARLNIQLGLRRYFTVNHEERGRHIHNFIRSVDAMHASFWVMYGLVYWMFLEYMYMRSQMYNKRENDKNITTEAVFKPGFFPVFRLLA